MSKRKLELIDLLKNTDTALSECRAAIDDHARGRKFREVAEVGGTLVQHAKDAAAAQIELDRILEEEWVARRGR